MLTRIKIQCGCGQRYAFDVEPIGDRLPGAVSCPSCGADGTGAGNAILAERAPAAAPIAVAAPALVAASGARGVAQMGIAASAPAMPSPVIPRPGSTPSVRVSGPPPSAEAVHAATAPPPPPPAERKRLPGQLDPQTARNEARSKIIWGDDPADVQKFLRTNGFTQAEAEEIIAPILVERALAVRGVGKGRIITGIGMMLLPVVTFIVCMMVGYFPLKIIGATVAIGFWGLWRLIAGIIMVVSPNPKKATSPTCSAFISSASSESDSSAQSRYSASQPSQDAAHAAPNH